jgi:cell division protein FtsB
VNRKLSIHGNQYVLPLFNVSSQIPPINENDELTLAFYLLLKQKRETEKILSFSNLLWPFLTIQGVISTHIIIDGLSVFSKQGTITNPPRQPLIGHLLRNIENRSKIDQLTKINEILSYKDVEAQEIGDSEESEYQKIIIEGLVNPAFLQTLAKLLPLIEYRSINQFQPLDSTLSTELALEIADKYRKIIENLKGNALRWHNQVELISKEVDKWLIDLSVQLKDIETRYSSQINKTSQSIDDIQIREKLDLERDRIDQWKVDEKKKIIESVSVLFKTVERQIEEIIKKNKFYTQSDSLKSRVFEDVLTNFENHFAYLLEEGKNFIELVTNLTKKYVELKERSSIIDSDANEQLTRFTSTLDTQLKDRNAHLTQFEMEKQEKIAEISNLRNMIEELFNQSKILINSKQGKCLQEAKDLITWSLNDNRAEIFSRPIQWIYMPLYAMIVEDQETMEEKIRFIFPGNISQDSNNMYRELSEEIINLRDHLDESLEDDMALRSNFEFSCENKNLIREKNFDKRIQQGISILRNKSLLNDDMEKLIRQNLNF